MEQILRAFSRVISNQEQLEEYQQIEQKYFQAVFVYVTRQVEEEQVFPGGAAA